MKKYLLIFFIAASVALGLLQNFTYQTSRRKQIIVNAQNNESTPTDDFDEDEEAYESNQIIRNEENTNKILV